MYAHFQREIKMVSVQYIGFIDDLLLCKYSYESEIPQGE